MSDFQRYRRTQIAEMRPYEAGEVLSARVSVSAPDREAGSPKVGDMIARNPKNYEDQWLVAADYFADNFEPLGAVGDGDPEVDAEGEVAEIPPVWAIGLMLVAAAGIGGCVVYAVGRLLWGVLRAD